MMPPSNAHQSTKTNSSYPVPWFDPSIHLTDETERIVHAFTQVPVPVPIHQSDPRVPHGHRRRPTAHGATAKTVPDK
jgi:hypothetical protein